MKACKRAEIYPFTPKGACAYVEIYKSRRRGTAERKVTMQMETKK